MPGQTTGVSVFTPGLMEALHLSSQQLSIAYGFGTICSGILLVRAGRMVDRFGVRRMMVFSCVALSFVLLYLANSGRIVDIGLSITGDRIPVAVSLSVAMLGFFLLRFFGQGMMAMIPRVMIGKWFDKKRGLAAGISGVIVSLGFGLAPFVFSLLIASFSWRGAYGLLAAIIGIGVATTCWIFYREQPEDSGLTKDGLPEENLSNSSSGGRVRQFTLSEVRRNNSFWVYSLGLGGNGLVITAISFHILSLAENAGLTEKQGLAIFIPMSILSMTSNLIGGWISDRTKLKYLLIFMMIMQAIGTIAMINFGDPVWRVVIIIAFGFSGGMFGTLINVTWPRYFGTLHLGAISGQNVSIMVMMTSAGPVLLAASKENLGGYTPGLLLFTLIPIAVAIAATRAKNPQPSAMK
ncbi:MAG: MFS transporter [Candidatus Hydrogenedentota bacterium]